MVGSSVYVGHRSTYFKRPSRQKAERGSQALLSEIRTWVAPRPALLLLVLGAVVWLSLWAALSFPALIPIYNYSHTT